MDIVLSMKFSSYNIITLSFLWDHHAWLLDSLTVVQVVQVLVVALLDHSTVSVTDTVILRITVVMIFTKPVQLHQQILNSWTSNVCLHNITITKVMHDIVN